MKPLPTEQKQIKMIVDVCIPPSVSIALQWDDPAERRHFNMSSFTGDYSIKSNGLQRSRRLLSKGWEERWLEERIGLKMLGASYLDANQRL